MCDSVLILSAVVIPNAGAFRARWIRTWQNVDLARKRFKPPFLLRARHSRKGQTSIKSKLTGFCSRDFVL
jgi:hypothetical protein